MSKAIEFIQRRSVFVFVLLVLILSLIFEYHETTLLLPQGCHDWRTTDCASFAMMYYEHGMHFFEPKVFNVLMGGGHAAGEFPGLYYLVACMYKLFGPHEVIFRVFFLLLFYAGLIALFKIVKRLTGDLLLSFIIPLLLFCSPLIMVFGNNFLCDIPSLSMALIGWSFVFKYRDTTREKHFWLGMIFFAFGALLKLNSAISMMALAGMFFLELAGWVQLGKEGKMFRNPVSNIAGFLMVVIIVSSWYLWAIDYNGEHSTSFLGTQSWPGWPIWETSDNDFLRTQNHFFEHANYLYSYITCIVLGFLLFYSLTNGKQLDPLMYGVLILTMLGIIMFVCMFYVGVGDNIYYIINLMIFPVFILITSAIIFKKKFPGIYHSGLFKILLCGFLVFNVTYAKGKLKVFYHGGKYHWKSNPGFYEPGFRPFVDSIGVKKTDKIISFPDITPDVTLYLISRPGWSGYDAKIEEGSINNCINNGAKYLFINNPMLLFDPVIMNYTGDFVANYGTIFIYRLSSPAQKTIAIRGVLKDGNNQYITIANEGAKPLRATADSTQGAIFTILPIGKGLVAIKSEENKTLSCDLNQGGMVTASTEWINKWEIFRMVENDDKTISIKGVNEKFISSEGGNVSAKSDQAGPSERFRVIYK